MFWSGVRPSHSTSNSRLSQTRHLFTFWCYHLEVRLCSRGRQRTCHTEGDSARTTRHFYRTFSCRRFFEHSPHEGVYPIHSRLQVNLLCGADWLCLRGIAATGRAILPTRELASYAQCSACAHPSSRGAPLGPSLLASTGAYRRISLTARSSVLVSELWQGRQPQWTVSATQNQTSGNGTWM